MHAYKSEIFVTRFENWVLDVKKTITKNIQFEIFTTIK